MNKWEEKITEDVVIMNGFTDESYAKLMIHKSKIYGAVKPTKIGGYLFHQNTPIILLNSNSRYSK